MPNRVMLREGRNRCLGVAIAAMLSLAACEGSHSVAGSASGGAGVGGTAGTAETGGSAGGGAGFANVGATYRCEGFVRSTSETGGNGTGGTGMGGAGGETTASAGGGGGGGGGGNTGTGGSSGPICVVGQTFCSKTIQGIYQQGSCEALTPNSAVCAGNPTCDCVCSHQICCLGRHFTSCSDADGLLIVTCGGV